MRIAGIFLLWMAGSGLAAVSAQFDAPVYHYEGDVRIDPESGFLSASWQIETLTDGPDEIAFVLSPSLGNLEVAGDVTGFRTGEMGPFTTITLQLAEGGAGRTIALSYDGMLLPEPMDNDINAITPERVELTVDSFWLPVDAGFRGFLTADVTIDVGAPWDGVGNGVVTRLDYGVRLVNDESSLDIAFTMAPEFRVTQADRFTLYDLRDHEGGIDALTEAAEFCAAYLDGLYGARDPLPRAHLVIHERESSAYNRRSYITFTDIAGTAPEPLTQFACHELAHHWSAGADFMTVENWLNESFAEYAGAMALRERFGEAAFLDRLQSYRSRIAGEDLPPIWVEGATERRPYLVNYRAGPVALWYLETYLGRPAFQALLTRYMVDGIDTTPDLLDALEMLEGREARDWFEAELARTAR